MLWSTITSYKFDQYMAFQWPLNLTPNDANKRKTLRPESSENIPILLQEADPDFSNQNDLRNPKMGLKQSVVVATQ